VSNRLVYAATLVALTGVYFAAGRLGLAVAYVHPSASPVWPPSGIALAAVLLLGLRVWPGIFAGAFLVNLTTAVGFASSLGIACGNTLEAVAGGFLVARFARGPEAFERPQDVIKFVVLAGLLATALSATIGTGVLALGGSVAAPEVGPVWLTWWLGDASGALVVAPALILWISGEPFACGRAQLLEAVGFLVTLVAVAAIAFGVSPDPLRFLCLPLTIWTAFRFGTRGTAMAVLMLSGFAVWGVLRNLGVLPSEEANRALLLLQVFMGVIALAGMTLAAAVAERRRALEALETQARDLARSNAELEDFAHVVSHDLKAPLRGISSLSAWLAEDCKDVLPGESARQLRQLESRTKRMAQLIDGVLTYSSVARSRPRRERVDSGTVVSEVIDTLAPTKVPIRVEGALPGVRYDRTQLVQVFQNLITNALQHMGREDGEIVVSCRERHEAFEFSVSDDGVGIDERHAERIFQMFQTLHPERETTGVGLTIAKKIVELHGGKIQMESLPGVGTSFRFSVPKQPRDRSRERG
jgi:signal transduction histidine kinase